MKSAAMVKISVGPQRESWLIHEDVICERVQFFKKAFMGGFMEAGKKEIFLEDDDPQVFGHFIDWLYGKSLHCQLDHSNPSDVTFNHIEQWLRLYIFADKISLVELAKEALEQYQFCSDGTLPCTKEVQLIYENTPGYCALRAHAVEALVVEFFCQGPDDVDFLADAIACHIDFTRDVTKAIKDHTRLSVKECELSSCSAHNKAPRVILRVDGGQNSRRAGKGRLWSCR
jgi:hypothetical protein